MSVIPAHELEGDTLETDVAIVGSGPAGLSLASRLETDFVVVESGGDGLDIQNHHKFHSIISGEPCQLDSLRVRGIGGASLRWTGRCIPMDEVDFEDRPWISSTTWPVSYGEMQPWFDEAAVVLQLPELDELSPERSEAHAGLVSASDRFRPSYWRYADNRYGSMRFGKQFKDIFEGSGRILLHDAHCVDFENGSEKVDALKLVDRNGRVVTLKAKRFVIAAGCIETSRLLLVAAHNHRELLAEVEPWLGKGFAQHLRLNAGEILADEAGFRRLQLAINIERKTGINHLETGLVIAPDFAKKAQIGNASLILRYRQEDGSRRANFWPRLAGKALGETPILNRVAASLEIDSEQVVSKSSYVALADQKDPLGMPRARVHWTIDETDCRTGYYAMTEFGNLIRNAGIGSLEPAPGITETSIDHAFRRESNHQLGGTRMSENASDGVVDPHLKVHGTDNLWVVGGSVFPTGGHANPTMTIVALALRLADRLNQRAG